MEVVVVHILAKSFGHCPVALIGVHHSGEDILLTAYNLHGGFVSISIKLFCKFIATMVVEVSGVHIKNQLAVFDGIRFQTSGGDHAVLLHLLKHFYIIVRGCFEMNVHAKCAPVRCPDCCSCPFHAHCVPVPLPHPPGFPSPGSGLRYDLFHRFLPWALRPFFEIYRQREGWGTALFQSVITHYYTFIHTGCKVPWALRGLSRGGVRSLR